jgi:hypothetical protein
MPTLNRIRSLGFFETVRAMGPAAMMLWPLLLVVYAIAIVSGIAIVEGWAWGRRLYLCLGPVLVFLGEPLYLLLVIPFISQLAVIGCIALWDISVVLYTVPAILLLERSTVSSGSAR